MRHPNSIDSTFASCRARVRGRLLALSCVAAALLAFAPPTLAAEAPGEDLAREAARLAVAARGYSAISGLAQSEAGLWVGEAQRDGKLWLVEVDVRGNFTSTPLAASRAPAGGKRRRVQLFLVFPAR